MVSDSSDSNSDGDDGFADNDLGEDAERADEHLPLAIVLEMCLVRPVMMQYRQVWLYACECEYPYYCMYVCIRAYVCA